MEDEQMDKNEKGTYIYLCVYIVRALDKAVNAVNRNYIKVIVNEH